MPALTAADTIRILVSTDNHVGYNERDPVRGDDSWKSFHEVMCLAKEQDVDMVLLAGDLFHENKPSRKSMYQVMRSLRMNCYGEKPCQLEMLSDASENFQGAFNHVNYEDLDINVAIPVFSIHGNHDDPSGEGHLAALDLLQISGLINYYGRTPESDNILIKPVLLQKGRTKLALYGMSNVRDERLFRTFRDGKVKFFQPGTQKSDWFNLMSVHQNHHAYTETGYLPEHFLPDFLDLVVWGHEHECFIDPRLNPETKFHVMQPGSSVATSLVPGEAVPKRIAILSITGRDFKTENIRLKTVRPFVMKEIILHEDKEAVKLLKKSNNRSELTRFLMSVVDELIEEAKNEWLEAQDPQDEDDDDSIEVPLPLVRLRVEVSVPPDSGGGAFDCENPQRFSNRFVGKVANVNDVVQFYRKKKGATTIRGGNSSKDETADEAILSHLSGLDTVKVEKFVREFLLAQSLTILPQNSFGDAVSQFVDKDDKHAMELFVNESLAGQIKHLMALDRANRDEEDDGEDEEDSSLQQAMDKYRSQLEDMFAKGSGRRRGRGGVGGKQRFKPKPDGWDSEFDGAWEDQPGALVREDDGTNGNGVDDDEKNETPARISAARGRGRGRGGTGRTAAASASSTRRAAPAKKAAPAQKTTGKGRKRAVVEKSDEEDEEEDAVMEDDDDEEDVVMLDDDEEEDEAPNSMFVSQPKPAATKSRSKAAAAAKPMAKGRKAASPIKKLPPRAAASRAKQSTLNFASQASGTVGRSTAGGGIGGGRRSVSVQGDDIVDDDDDDDDAFESTAPKTRSGRR